MPTSIRTRSLLIFLLMWVPLAVAAGINELKYVDGDSEVYRVSRAEAMAAAAKIKVAALELDAYLASDAAKQFDAEVSEEELPVEVLAILSRAGIDGESGESAIPVVGMMLFKVCDNENAALLQLRTQWVARIGGLAFLSLSAEEKKAYSPAAIAQIRTSMLPIAQGFADSLLVSAATSVGCSAQALRYADFALADSTHKLADALLGMTRSGLLLDASNGNKSLIAAALAAHREAMNSMTREVKLFDRALRKQASELAENASDIFELSQNYAVEFERALNMRQTPRWQVQLSAGAKTVSINRFRCGTGAALYRLYLGLAMPNWPSAQAALHARGDHQSIADYALADMFDSDDPVSRLMHQPIWSGENDPETVIWQVYGKTETKAELERAAAGIVLTAPESGIAIVQIFGHSFQLASGEIDHRESSQATRWFTLAEIQTNFRQSSAFRALTDSN